MANRVRWREFEIFAQERMSKHFGVPLHSNAPDDFPKKFDLVSQDETIVGDAKYLTMVARQYEPPAKLMEITGHVWLLEKVRARTRFLVFGNQILVAQVRRSTIKRRILLSRSERQGHQLTQTQSPRVR